MDTRDKIKSPKTRKIIIVDGDAYNKLLNEGYTRDELSHYLIKPFNQYTLNPVDIPIDILYEILYQSPPDAIHQLCITSKSMYQICQSNQFWVNKLNNENLPLLENFNTYKDWLHYYIKIDKIKKMIDNINILLQYNAGVDLYFKNGRFLRMDKNNKLSIDLLYNNITKVNIQITRSVAIVGYEELYNKLLALSKKKSKVGELSKELLKVLKF